MKIFLSWSGERSKQVASALHEILKTVLHFAEPWMSEIDIESGSRGLKDISKELEGRNFGIICITPENLRAPWINFEAVALSKSVENGRVVPLLLGMDAKDIPPPLGQFQAKKLDKDGVKGIVYDINRSAAAPIDQIILDKLFDAMWVSFDTAINAIPKSTSAEPAPRKESEILEELVTGVRNLENRVRDVSLEGVERNFRSSKRLRRVHPGMLLEASEMMMEKSSDPIFLLFLAGMVRDEMPWLTEILTESYREFRSGSQAQVEQSIHRLRRTLKMLERGHPLIRELLGESKDAIVFASELPHLIDLALLRHFEFRKEMQRVDRDVDDIL